MVDRWRRATATKVISVAAAIRLAIRISSSRSRIRTRNLSIAMRAGRNRHAPRLLSSAYARLLVDRLDEILANARGHLLMDLEQLLAPLRLFLWRRRIDLDRAGRLDLGERFFILLYRDRVAIGSGLLHRGFELAADIA